VIPEPLLRVAFVSIVIFLAAVVFLFIIFFFVRLFPEEDISSYISGTRSVHAQWYAQPPLRNERLHGLL
jgi:hypothetical protein